VKEHKFVSAVIRMRNAETRVAHFLTEIDGYLDGRFDSYEIVVVNDASHDRSSEIVKSLSSNLHGSLILIELAHNHGVEAAMVAGLDRAMGDFLFEFEDTYLDFPIELLDELYDTAVGGFDIVAGVPRPLPRRMRWFYRFCNRFSSFDPPLDHERVRVASRRAADAMLQQKERIRYRQVLYRFTGYRYARVTYAPKKGRTPRGADNVRLALDVFMSFTDAGVRVAHAFALLFALVSLVTIGWAIEVTAFGPQVPPWWLVYSAIASIAFTGIFVLLAVLGEYVARILAEVRSRPLYTLDKTLTWAITPTETKRVPSPVRAAERALATGDDEPFMLRQHRQAIVDLNAAREASPEPTAGG